MGRLQQVHESYAAAAWRLMETESKAVGHVPLLALTADLAVGGGHTLGFVLAPACDLKDAEELLEAALAEIRNGKVKVATGGALRIHKPKGEGG